MDEKIFYFGLAGIIGFFLLTRGSAYASTNYGYITKKEDNIAEESFAPSSYEMRRPVVRGTESCGNRSPSFPAQIGLTSGNPPAYEAFDWYSGRPKLFAPLQ